VGQGRHDFGPPTATTRQRVTYTKYFFDTLSPRDVDVSYTPLTHTPHNTACCGIRDRVLKWEVPDHIVDNIWLGGEGATMDAQWLRDHGINRVLTVAAHMERLVRHDGFA
jgi:methylmalonyl-CoA mutase cobalamin-binding subunit